MSEPRSRVVPPSVTALPRPSGDVLLSAAFPGALTDALSNLYDPAYLQINPLARLADRYGPPGVRTRGETLRLELLSAIDCLRPLEGGGRHPQRCHELLSLRYVEGLDVAAVQGRLAISRRQYYREHERALAALVSLLQERWTPVEARSQGTGTPPVSVPEPAPSHLPSQPGRLIGREEELAHAIALLEREDPPLRLLTLTGPAGSGKTRLALAVAHAQAARFAWGAHLVDLSPLRDARLVLSSIAQTLGVREEGNRSLQESLARYLRDKALLLVLDNCEQVAAAATQVGALLEECPLLRVLATSRVPLRLRWEQEFPVPPLGLPDLEQSRDPKALAKVPSVDLFVERTRALKPDFQLTVENVRAVAEICLRLDGLPLAIELAAGRGRSMPPQVILGRLAPRLALLQGRFQDQPPRHKSLREAIAWSYELLSTAEQRLFRHLCVFVGGCTLEAAQAVCSDEGDSEGVVLDALESLVASNLLLMHETEEGSRFGMLETIKEYGLECLEASGEGEAIHRRHAGFFYAFARRAGPELFRAQQAVWISRLALDYPNLCAAMSRSQPTVQGGVALGIASALWRYWVMRDQFSEGRRWLENALSTDSGEVPEDRAEALQALCKVTGFLGEYDSARRYGLESLAISRQRGDDSAAGAALDVLGIAALVQGYWDEACTSFEEGLAIYRRLNDKRMAAICLSNLTLAMAGEGDYSREQPSFLEALSLFREVGDVYNIGNVLLALAESAARQGMSLEARSYAEQCLVIAREIGSEVEVSTAKRYLADAAIIEGDYSAAAASLGDALRGLNEAGYWQELLGALNVAAGLTNALSRWERTARILGAVDGLYSDQAATPKLYERARLDAVAAACQQAMGADRYDAAFAAGRAMSLDEAVAYALDTLALVEGAIARRP